MRKSATGVLAAAGLAIAAPASADVSISGSMTEDIGFGSWIGNDPAMDDVHFQTGAKITFTGSGTTDGGLTVSATVAMDADSSGSIDESNLSIAGGFGKIILGSEDNAANMIGNKGIGNGYAGTGYYDGGENYTPAGSAGPVPNSDGVGIRYITPDIGGFQAGVSWQPQEESGDLGNSGGASTTTNDRHILAAGASFAGDFGGTNMTIGANFVSERSGGMDSMTKKAWGLGSSFGIGSTTLNVRYDTKGDNHENGKYAMMMEDNKSYGIGVDHVIGALTFGIGYGVGTDENAVVKGRVDAPHYPDDDTENPKRFKRGDINMDLVTDGRKTLDRTTSVLSVGAKYDLGGGVSVHAAITSGKIENAAVTGTGTPMHMCDEEMDDSNLVGTMCYADIAFKDGDPKTGVLLDEQTGTPSVSHYKVFGLEDLEDVGVGLRIALSF